MEHYFTPDEKRQQLRQLIAALTDLVPVLAVTPGYEGHVAAFETVLDQAERALVEGFDQAKLSDLAGAVPRLFHPRWEPPLEQLADGRWQEPDWYQALAAKLDPVLKAADALRTVGYRT
ncbi:hypothetical protein [Caulobacter endophyticus]|uniref:hypothetical protein n=1 Tax=Caulobacter endophyticus TaxID=2172652 RepID=UPI0024103E6A|nr:hypothetical protein [Caulobacter endophyticus]MDG2530398.1 hypothetical protein [Caulobacter endophyticus]